MAAKDFKLLSNMDHILSAIGYLRPAQSASLQDFLNKLLPIATLDPLIADREMGVIQTKVQFTISHFDRAFDDLAKRKAMLANIDQWVALAKHIGNKKSASMALYYRGGLHKHSGQFDQAARDFAQAHAYLTEINYLRLSTSMADQIEQNLEFGDRGGPEAIARQAEAKALKRKDFEAAAKAENALGKINTA